MSSALQQLESRSKWLDLVLHLIPDEVPAQLPHPLLKWSGLKHLLCRWLLHFNNSMEASKEEIATLPYEKILKIQRVMTFSKKRMDYAEYQVKQWALTGDPLGIEAARTVLLVQDLYGRLESAKVLKEPKKPWVRSVMTPPEGFDYDSRYSRTELYEQSEG